MASLQTQMAQTVASAAGLTGSLPTAEARSDLASETPLEPRKGKRPTRLWPPSDIEKDGNGSSPKNRLKKECRQQIPNTNKIMNIKKHLAIPILAIVATMLVGCKKAKINPDKEIQDHIFPFSFATSVLPHHNDRGDDELNQMVIGVERGIPYSLRNMKAAADFIEAHTGHDKSQLFQLIIMCSLIHQLKHI